VALAIKVHGRTGFPEYHTGGKGFIGYRTFGDSGHGGIRRAARIRTADRNITLAGFRSDATQLRKNAAHPAFLAFAAMPKVNGADMRPVRRLPWRAASGRSRRCRAYPYRIRHFASHH
jgi:hypothetical protein